MSSEPIRDPPRLSNDTVSHASSSLHVISVENVDAPATPQAHTSGTPRTRPPAADVTTSSRHPPDAASSIAHRIIHDAPSSPHPASSQSSPRSSSSSSRPSTPPAPPSRFVVSLDTGELDGAHGDASPHPFAPISGSSRSRSKSPLMSPSSRSSSFSRPRSRSVSAATERDAKSPLPGPAPRRGRRFRRSSAPDVQATLRVQDATEDYVRKPLYLQNNVKNITAELEDLFVFNLSTPAPSPRHSSRSDKPKHSEPALRYRQYSGSTTASTRSLLKRTQQRSMRTFEQAHRAEREFYAAANACQRMLHALAFPLSALVRQQESALHGLQLLLLVVHTIVLSVLFSLHLSGAQSSTPSAGALAFFYIFDVLQMLEIYRIREFVRCFRLHTAALFPLDLVALLAFPSTAIPFLSLRFARLLLFYRRPDAYMKRVTRLLHVYPSQALSRFGKLITSGFALAHVSACALLVLGTEWDDNDPTLQLHPDSGWTRYLRALYWMSVTCTTLGYGDIVPKTDAERLYVLVVLLVGMLLLGAVIATMTSMLFNADSASLAVQRKRLTVRLLLAQTKKQTKNVTQNEAIRSEDFEELTDRLDDAYDKAFKQRRGLTHDDLLRYLPRPDAFNLLMHMAKFPVLSAFAPFANTQMLVSIVHLMKFEEQPSGALLFSHEQTPTRMFMILSGRVRREFPEEPMSFAEVNESVGLKDILLAFRLYRFDAYAHSDSSFFILSSTDLAKIERVFPEAVAQLRGDLRQEIMQDHHVSEHMEAYSAASADTPISGAAIGDYNSADVLRDLPQIARRRASSHVSNGRRASVSAAVNSQLRKHLARVGTKAVHQGPRFSNASRLWLGFRIFVTLYYAVCVPYRLAFHSWGMTQTFDALFTDSPVMAAWTLLDMLLDVAVLYELVVRVSQDAGDGTADNNMSIASGISLMSVMASDDLEHHPMRISAELFASLPVDYIVLLATGGNVSAWAAVRLIKIVRLNFLFDDANVVYGNSRWLSLAINSQAWRVLQQVFTTVVVAHWVSCLWYMVALQSESREGKSWLGADERSTAGDDTYAPLLRSWYWTFSTITSQGYGDIVPLSQLETAFAFTVIGFGSWMYPGLVANLSTLLIGDRHSPAVNHATQTERVLQLLNKLDCPRVIRANVARYLEMSWDLNRGLKIEEALSSLPQGMRSETRRVIYGTLLREDVAGAASPPSATFQGITTLFEDCHEDFIDALACTAEIMILPKHSVLYYRNDLPEHGFGIVLTGRMFLTVGGHMRLNKVFGVGEVFGAAESFLNIPRLGTIKASSQSQVALFRQPFVQDVLARFPDEASRVLERARQMVSRRSQAKAELNLHASPKLAKLLSGKSKSALLASPSSVHSRASRSLSRQDSRFMALTTHTLFEADDSRLTHWRLLQIALGVYIAAMLPFMASFRFNTPDAELLVASFDESRLSLVLFIVDILTDVLFWADIVLYGLFVVPRSLRLDDPASVARLPRVTLVKLHWRHSFKFRADIVGCLPLDWILPLATPLAPAMGITAGQLRHLLRLLRLLRLVRIRIYAFLLVEQAYRHAHWLSRNAITLTWLVFSIVFGSYALGALWYAVGEHDGSGSHGWVSRDGIDASSDSASEEADKVIRALYWVQTTLITVGFGDIVPHSTAETLFALVVMLSGTLVFAMTVAIIASIVAQSHETAAAYLQQRNAMNRLLVTHGIRDSSAGEAALNHLDTLWKVSFGVEPDGVLRHLPDPIRVDLLGYLIGVSPEHSRPKVRKHSWAASDFGASEGRIPSSSKMQQMMGMSDRALGSMGKGNGKRRDKHREQEQVTQLAPCVPATSIFANYPQHVRRALLSRCRLIVGAPGATVVDLDTMPVDILWFIKGRLKVVRASDGEGEALEAEDDRQSFPTAMASQMSLLSQLDNSEAVVAAKARAHLPPQLRELDDCQGAAEVYNAEEVFHRRLSTKALTCETECVFIALSVSDFDAVMASVDEAESCLRQEQGRRQDSDDGAQEPPPSAPQRRARRAAQQDSLTTRSERQLSVASATSGRAARSLSLRALQRQNTASSAVSAASGAAIESSDGGVRSIRSVLSMGLRRVTSAETHANTTLPRPSEYFYVHPKSPVAQAWSFLVTCALLLLWVQTPLLWVSALNAHRADPTSIPEIMLVLAYVCDAVLLLDVVLQASVIVRRLSGSNQSSLTGITVYVWRRADVFRHYFSAKGDGRLDLLALMPVELLALAADSDSVRANQASLWMLLRTWRLLRTHTLWRRLHRLLAALFSDHFLRFTQVLVVLAFVSHLSACGWLMLLHVQSGRTTQDTGYLGALYFAFVTLTSLGYGDIAPQTSLETVYVCVMMVVGATCYASIIAHLTSLFKSSDGADASATTATQAINQYAREWKLPSDARHIAAKRAFVHQARVRGVDAGELLHSLPLHVRYPLLDTMAGDAVRIMWSQLEMPFNMQAASAIGDAFLYQLISTLRPWSVSEGDVLCVRGAAVLHLFLAPLNLLEVVHKTPEPTGIRIGGRDAPDEVELARLGGSMAVNIASQPKLPHSGRSSHSSDDHHDGEPASDDGNHDNAGFDDANKIDYDSVSALVSAGWIETRNGEHSYHHTVKVAAAGGVVFVCDIDELVELFTEHEDVAMMFQM